MTDQTTTTRHVTLLVTTARGHATFDHHLRHQAAADVEAMVGALPETPGGGRFVALHSSGPGGRVEYPWVEVDNDTADRVIAAMRAHMPPRTYTELLADAAEYLRRDAEAGGLVAEIDAALTHPEESHG